MQRHRGEDQVKMKAEIRIMLPLAKKAWSPQKLEKAIKDSPQSLQRQCSPASPSILSFGLQNGNRIDFCYFKLPGFQYFAVAALGTECSIITEMTFGLGYEGSMVFRVYHVVRCMAFLGEGIPESSLGVGKRKWVFQILEWEMNVVGEVKLSKREWGWGQR